MRRAVDDAALVLSRTRAASTANLRHGVSRDGAIVRRHGRYAEAMVVFAEPTQAYRLGFALGVQLFVERAEGLTLFQQRGLDRTRPALVDGLRLRGLSHWEQPRDAVLADAAEEIGLAEADLEGFCPVARSSSATTPARRSSSTARSSAKAPSPSRTSSRSRSSSGLPRRPTWEPRSPPTPLPAGRRSSSGATPGGPRRSDGCYVRSSGPSPPVTFCHQSSSRRFSSP